MKYRIYKMTKDGWELHKIVHREEQVLKEVSNISRYIIIKELPDQDEVIDIKSIEKTLKLRKR